MVERGIDVAQEPLPVVLIDPEPAMGQLHLASDVVQRATGGSTEEIDQELFFAAHAVFAAMLPEPPKPWIRHQPRQQVVGDGRDRIVAAQALVERIRHGILPRVRVVEPRSMNCNRSAPGRGERRALAYELTYPEFGFDTRCVRGARRVAPRGCRGDR